MSLSLRMQPVPEGSRGPPKPYVIDGERFYNLWQAAAIITTVTAPTLRRWAALGAAPFGFELNPRREPMLHNRLREEAKTRREYRTLLPVAEVEALKEILQNDPIRPGFPSRDQMRRLEAAARRFRSTEH
jgi:hypothetical protein